jgi:hypothetical protein
MTNAEHIYEKVRSLPGPTQVAVLEMIDAVSNASSNVRLPRVALNFVQQFEELANTWRNETSRLSFIQQRAIHPAYQRIIGMGWPVVPLILLELQKRPEHWFWALNAITGEAPAAVGDSFQAAANAWLRWGKERGLISDE